MLPEFRDPPCPLGCPSCEENMDYGLGPFTWKDLVVCGITAVALFGLAYLICGGC